VHSPSHFSIELPADLLAAVQRGDMAAFERLFRLFERPVYALAIRVLEDREEAMDVLHDTFIKLRQALPGFRGESPFWGWLRQIAINEALMRVRRRATRPALDWLDEHEAQLPTTPPSRAAEAVDLERALGALPALTRSVLWLYHGEGHTHEEIAELLGRSVSFSKSQLARGTHKLRGLLSTPDSPRRATEAHHVG